VPRNASLETRWIGPPPEAAPTVVFLHEGLGCAALWRDFPDRVAAATGCGALVYSRRGYGKSEPLPGPWPLTFMHEEAELLPALLSRFAIKDPILYGHSDGASIAILYAGPVRARILEAPHVFVEPVCIESIRKVSQNARLRDRLARYLRPGTFDAWCDVWLRPEFAQWNIEEALPRITEPMLVIQGTNDEYGTLRQVEAIKAAETLILPGCGHSPHSEKPNDVVDAIKRFL
jgi:pimeloyl-ACP methyl ester carboxylesterase